jgi:hypothetical protein
MSPVRCASRSDSGTEVPVLVAWYCSVLRRNVTGVLTANGSTMTPNPTTSPAM